MHGKGWEDGDGMVVECRCDARGMQSFALSLRGALPGERGKNAGSGPGERLVEG